LTNVSALNSYRLAKGNSVDLSIDYVADTRIASGTAGTAATTNGGSGGTLISTGAYNFALERLNWASSVTGRTASTFMSGDTNWRTSTVTLP
jgi:hypothetical protein